MTECIDGSRAARRAGGPLHAAVVYDSDDALRDRAAPFVREGLDRGETILAAVPSQVEQVLRSVLGVDGGDAHWREPGLMHRRTGEAYEDCRAPAARVRLGGRPSSVRGGAGRGGVPRGDRQRTAARPSTLPRPGVAVRGRSPCAGRRRRPRDGCDDGRLRSPGDTHQLGHGAVGGPAADRRRPHPGRLHPRHGGGTPVPVTDRRLPGKPEGV